MEWKRNSGCSDPNAVSAPGKTAGKYDAGIVKQLLSLKLKRIDFLYDLLNRLRILLCDFVNDLYRLIDI